MNGGMRRSTLAAVLLLLATSAAGEDFYLPLGGAASRTELQIANPSLTRARVVIELLGSAGTAAITVEGGQTMCWNDAAVELFGGASSEGALRIGADAAVQVTAVRHCAACGASVSVPVLGARQAVDEGAVQMRAGGPWRSGMLVVNPDDGVALMTFSVRRGNELVDQSLLVIPARGVRRVQLDGGADERVTFRSARPLLLFRYDSNEDSGARVFTPVAPHAVIGRRRSVRSGTPRPPPPPEPQTIVLTPSKDNTLYQSSDGSLSNAKGIHLFAGATGSRSLRRALLAFDVASQIPPGSRITRVTLELQLSLTIAGPQPMTLHRVTADWGEGASGAGPVRDGVGTDAEAGDATWLHRFFPGQPWATQGGDFNAAADATAIVEESGSWQSSEAMIARVQGWLDQPSTNFGWIVIGNETRSTTAKRFDSREDDPASGRPALTVEFLR
ncbi:MAG: hypothetical protein QOJ98_1503 [Acidobacteriota bacterium]|nr:hypothetical protein [Acidobacteriota bacterium]